MRDQDKNRDPARAQKRAVADARCALRKLGLLSPLAAWMRLGHPSAEVVCKRIHEALDVQDREANEGAAR
ncbi:MAG: hypothetical protein GY824_09655, partial [Delftia sp.]|nr:hypothetical protein [Delftia sp.]